METSKAMVAEYRSLLSSEIIKMNLESNINEANILQEWSNKIPEMPLRNNCSIGINDGTFQYVATLEVCFILLSFYF